MKKFNVIGDIHGRTKWKELVKDNAVNIFVGDYFDPYDDYTFEELKENFLNIIEYKKQHPETILLIGNHDAHYIYGAESSRFNYEHKYDIKELFNKYREDMQVIFATENYLISHAGVGIGWYEKFIPEIEKTPKALAEAINYLWDNYHYKEFRFETNCDLLDVYGTYKDHSCLWIRPSTLLKNNVFIGTDYKQVVGHTQTYSDIKETNNIIFIDVLETETQSFEFNDNEIK